MKIRSNRLILREFVESDWAAVLAYQSNPLYLRYYPWESRSAAEVQAFVRMFLKQQGAEPRLKYQLAVTLKSSGQLIGNCGLRRDSVTAVSGDIGYEFAPEHWGHGYATEAAQAILQFGFETVNLHRIWASCLADNEGSARVLQKLGMQMEGHLRQNEFFKGRYWDTLIFGILREEWQAQFC